MVFTEEVRINLVSFQLWIKTKRNKKGLTLHVGNMANDSSLGENDEESVCLDFTKSATRSLSKRGGCRWCSIPAIEI